MLSRFRSQLRLLTVASVAVAALAVPAIASAATSNFYVSGGYGVDETADADGELTSATRYETTSFSYLLDVDNNSTLDDGAPADATGPLNLEAELDESAIVDLAGLKTELGATECLQEVVAGRRFVNCSGVPSIPAGGTTTFGFPVKYGATDGMFTDFDTTVTAYFDFTQSGGDLNQGFGSKSESTTILDANPVCNGDEWEGEYLYYTGIALNAARTANASFDTAVSCSAPNGVAPTVQLQAGTASGQSGAPHTGTLDLGALLANGNTTAGDIVWTPGSAALETGRSFEDVYLLNVTGPTGIVSVMELTFSVAPQADLVVTSSVPTALAVAAGGTTTTFTSTVRNAGPNTAYDSYLFFQIGKKATYVSSSVNGTATACTPHRDDEILMVACPSPALTLGASATHSVTVRYQPGVNGLTLPSKELVFATTFGQSSSIGDADETNYENNHTKTELQLTAESPVIVTPPVDPSVGTTGNDNFVGTVGADTFNGGLGNDRFNGGLGNDTFRGGAGNDSGAGGVGNDFVYGEAGNDRVLGGAGNDLVDGGAGNDIVSGDAGIDKVFGGLGNDKASGGAGNDKLDGGKGKDVLSGDAGNDVISAFDKTVDVIRCGKGKDTVVADRKDKVSKDCERVTRK